MKHLLLFVVLSGVALAAAGEDPASASVEVRGSQIQLPDRAYPMVPRDFDAYVGAYHLSNGEIMVLRRSGRLLFAEVGNRPAKELVATDHNAFVARDRQLKMTLKESFGGYIRGEMLMVVPRSISSTGRGDEVRLISMR